MNNDNDTIAAVSTCPGEAGIGIVRMSGPCALSIASKIFRPKNKKDVNRFATHTVHLGAVVEGERAVDEALLTVMRAPRSYTCEDIAEISCHGGLLIIKKVVELCVKNGARPAEPGEFTKRAYLNGRLDLSQAEAVCDVIKARTDAALSCAVSQLSGALSNLVNKQKGLLTDLMAELEAGIDYSEEDIPSPGPGVISKKIAEVEAGIERIVSTFETGKILKNGVRTAIIGRPNVGKSSLLNALTGEDRAIVTEFPGTTRDVIEETLNIGGIPLVLMDTAGIRKHTSDAVEKIGIDRAYGAIKNAELVLFVLDASLEPDGEDRRIKGLIGGKKKIFVLNKCDLGVAAGAAAFADGAAAAKISALKNEGMDGLKKVIYGMFITKGTGAGEFLLTSVRHKVLLDDAAEHLGKARAAAENGMSAEFVAADVRAALDSLGGITGDVTTEDILGRIFSNFCVGK